MIRGESSITGANQPLFIIDGIPVSNAIGDRVGILTDQGGIDYGNAIQDINPDNIASITVLKGPNAAALYGSRASNGAILIETKKGRNVLGGAQIVVSQLVTFQDVLTLPDYQNQFGSGYNGEYSYYDGFGNGTNDEADESWGPPLDTGLEIPQVVQRVRPGHGHSGASAVGLESEQRAGLLRYGCHGHDKRLRVRLEREPPRSRGVQPDGPERDAARS